MSKCNPRRLDYKLPNSTGQSIENIATSEKNFNRTQSITSHKDVITICNQYQCPYPGSRRHHMDENSIETGADYQDVIQMLVELRKSIRENEHNLHTEIPDPIRVYR